MINLYTCVNFNNGIILINIIHKSVLIRSLYRKMYVLVSVTATIVISILSLNYYINEKIDKKIREYDDETINN